MQYICIGEAGNALYVGDLKKPRPDSAAIKYSARPDYSHKTEEDSRSDSLIGWGLLIVVPCAIVLSLIMESAAPFIGGIAIVVAITILAPAVAVLFSGRETLSRVTERSSKIPPEKASFEYAGWTVNANSIRLFYFGPHSSDLARYIKVLFKYEEYSPEAHAIIAAGREGLKEAHSYEVSQEICQLVWLSMADLNRQFWSARDLRSKESKEIEDSIRDALSSAERAINQNVQKLSHSSRKEKEYQERDYIAEKDARALEVTRFMLKGKRGN